MLTSQAADTRKDIADLQDRIARTPEVERGLTALTRDRENNFKEYQDILAKQQDAQLWENLEQNQQAEKFSILEPALRAGKAIKPRPAETDCACAVHRAGCWRRCSFCY